MLAIELKNISKTFGSTLANAHIHLAVEKGEVHALLGENGAGKSTLMKILFGLYKADKGGEIFINQKKILNPSPRVSTELGLGMVHQHFMLIRPLTILQNVILGAEPKKGFGRIDFKKAHQDVLNLSHQFQFNLHPDQIVDTLTVGMQQRVEILKVLYRHAEILIFDEPTAVLTPNEILEFFAILQNLKQDGKTIVLITHKLSEIKAVANRCSILRKGQLIETVDVATTSEEELASKMVGRTVERVVDRHVGRTGNRDNSHLLKPHLLKIENLSVKNSKSLFALKELSFEIHLGEIFGLAGIDGNGQSELVDALTGLSSGTITSGRILLDNQDITHLSPKAIYNHQLCSIPEDRQRRGLVLDFTLKENLVLQKIGQFPFSRKGIISYPALTDFANSLLDRFDIRPRDPDLQAKNFSGGNQQKIILAREIMANPKILVAFQPTRGLDVGAIEYIHRELISLRNQGKSILFISYELDEILHLSDRIGVIVNGKITATLDNQDSPDLKALIGLHMAAGEKQIRSKETHYHE